LFLELRIVKGLGARFLELRIPKDLRRSWAAKNVERSAALGGSLRDSG